jgi:hypothetical protein
MTRHPGISIVTGAPVRPQPEGIAFYWRRTHPAVRASGRINVTPAAAFGELIPQASRANQRPRIYTVGELPRLSRLSRTFRREKADTLGVRRDQSVRRFVLPNPKSPQEATESA